MKTTILIMLWASVSSSGGMTVLQQEFTTPDSCEHARRQLEKSHYSTNVKLVAQGCFPKLIP